MTRERGKISAFAKGARRQNSPLLAATTPFSFGEFVLYQGRTSYTVYQAQISTYFTEIKEDLEKVCYASYFAEFADYYTREHNDETEMLKLLYQTLKALGSGKIRADLIRYIYEWKSFVVNGEYPEVFACVSCGSTEGLETFSFDRQGVLCQECKQEGQQKMAVHPSLLYTLQYIIASDIQKLYTFTVTDEVLVQLKRLVTAYVERNIGRKFKSLEFLVENSL